MIISTAYFAPIAAIEAIARGQAVIEAHETFQKHSHRNRAAVMTADGVRLLSVPVIGGRGIRKPIREVEIDYTLPFQREHLRTITAAYRSAAYYEHFIDRIEPLFALRERYLFDLNCRITEELLSILKIDAPLLFTKQFEGTQPMPEMSVAPYFQVFSDRQPFAANLSILDYLFNNGRL